MNTIYSIPNYVKQSFATVISTLVYLLLFSSCNTDTTSNAAVQVAAKEGDEIATVAAMYVTPATEDIVMYEININAFSSTHNLRGIINRLDAIKALGVNTIWLMPIYPVGTINSFGSPYCVKNYTAVNPNLGTLSILQELVDKAHQRNLSVILDWVANHTSWDNAWMSHPDWYTHNASGQIISPVGTNWADVADLNYNNAEMRTAMIAAMRYWVNVAGVDGFRCDAADYVPFDFWQQAITTLQTGRRKQLIMLAEGERNDHFSAGFSMNWSWNYVTAIKNVFGAANFSPTSLYTVNTSEYTTVPAGSRKLRFTTNHDESNTALPVTVFNSKNGALCASAITIFLQGVPLLYSGQEVGVASTSVYNGGTINWTANADMLAGYQQLLAFYNSSAAARKGNLITYADANIFAFTKTLGNEQILVLANPRGSLSGFTVPPALAGNYLNVLTNATVSISSNLGFSAYKYLILKRIN